MRIRKNSRLIFGGLTSSASSSSLSPSSFLVCQLNRSPWDVLDPFSLQGDWDDSFESIPASDSLHSGESMELSYEYVEKSPPSLEEEEERENGIMKMDEEEELGLKTTTSHHQFSVIKRTVQATLPPVPKRRGRPKKAATTSPAAANTTTTATNPYEFYYYSGFGPKWAKRRGSDKPLEHKLAHCYSESGRNECSNKKKMKEKEKEREKDDNSVVMVEEELDYIDDYDDDEEDENSFYGGKRARKPIKARSLKSLM